MVDRKNASSRCIYPRRAIGSSCDTYRRCLCCRPLDSTSVQTGVSPSCRTSATNLLISTAFRNIALQRLMAYIVALTLIMQIIFAISTTTKNVVSRRLIKVALKTFIDSPQRVNIHSAIKQHCSQYLAAPFGRDAALQKITELIESNMISDDDMAKIKSIMKDVNVSNDEPW